MSLLSAVPSTPICSKRYIWYNLRSGVIYLFIYFFASLFLCFFGSRAAILVTNRWNRSHLSWIFSKFLTFTLHTFVLTQMCRSPSPMLSRAYFGALKWLQTQINIGEGKITQVFQDLWRGLWLGKRLQRLGRELNHSQMSPRAKPALAEWDWFPTKVNF